MNEKKNNGRVNYYNAFVFFDSYGGHLLTRYVDSTNSLDVYDNLTGNSVSNMMRCGGNETVSVALHHDKIIYF